MTKEQLLVLLNSDLSNDKKADILIKLMYKCSEHGLFGMVVY